MQTYSSEQRGSAITEVPRKMLWQLKSC